MARGQYYCNIPTAIPSVGNSVARCSGAFHRPRAHLLIFLILSSFPARTNSCLYEFGIRLRFHFDCLVVGCGFMTVHLGQVASVPIWLYLLFLVFFLFLCEGAALNGFCLG